MTADETQLVKTLLAAVALSVNASPEKLKEFIRIASLDSGQDKSTAVVSDVNTLAKAINLLHAYRDEATTHTAGFERRPFLRRVTPAIKVLEDCLRYYSNKE